MAKQDVYIALVKFLKEELGYPSVDEQDEKSMLSRRNDADFPICTTSFSVNTGIRDIVEGEGADIDNVNAVWPVRLQIAFLSGQGDNGEGYYGSRVRALTESTKLTQKFLTDFEEWAHNNVPDSCIYNVIKNESHADFPTSYSNIRVDAGLHFEFDIKFQYPREFTP
ncbi:MAG: hypothetical protein KAS32_22415 [Candidatus Peribacteraceae bacterium]|nr:hypothetical protein [Candidatus Peribacteraceae bacterium]